MTDNLTVAEREEKPFSLRDVFGGGRGGGLRQLGILGSLVVIMLLFQVLTAVKTGTGLTFSSENLINVVSQYSYILILAIGMVMVIIMGHIDLSVGSVAAFVGIVVAKSMSEWNVPWWVAILIGLVVGALVGAWQGFWVAFARVPAFIVTLAGMLIFRGANQWVGQATAVPVPADFQTIGAGYLPEVPGPFDFNVPTMALAAVGVVWIFWHELRLRHRQAKSFVPVTNFAVAMIRAVGMSVLLLGAAWQFATGRPGTSFPVSGVILVVLVIIYSFLTNNTVFGRHIYAVGGNRQAARLSGVKDRWVDFFVMMNMSVLAAVAGMIYVARATASGGQDGNGWELDAIASVFIGGAAVSGGIGTVIGSIIGGLVMAFLNNGLSLMSVTADKVAIIKGLVLLLAVAIDVASKNRGGPSITGLMMRRRAERAEATGRPDPVLAAAPGGAGEEAPQITDAPPSP